MTNQSGPPPSSGNEDFLLHLYEKLESAMFATAAYYLRQMADQEDVVQESMVKLSRHVEKLQKMHPNVLASYVTTTVKNAAIDLIRKYQRQQSRTDILSLQEERNLPAQGPTLDELAVSIEKAQKLRAAMEMLPEDDRYVLEGKYILGYTDRELAKQLGCKQGSIRVKLSRARKAVMEYMNQNEVE